MKRLLRCRRAVSPVIAAVLMIMVAIIGMSLLFAFFVNYARDFQLGRGSAVLESMVIENVWIHNSTTVSIWVYNVGKVDLEVSNVFVNDLRAVVTHVDGVPVAGSDSLFEVGVGEHVRFSVLSDSLRGDANLFRLVTARGSAVEGRY